jgi:hypothetical protein
MVEETIKLPGSSYDEVKKIIVAYTNVGKPAPLDEIARNAGMDKTIVSRNNGFLTSIGVISKGQQKEITSLGAELGRALEYDVTSDIAECWRRIVTEIEFFKNLISSVRIRRGMELSALRAHVAYSAGQSKSPGVLTGAGTIVEILKLAGALKEQDGKLIATEILPPRPTEISSSSDREPGSSDSPAHREDVPWKNPIPQTAEFSIQVQIVCKPDELDGLAEKLRKLLAELRQSNSSETGED